jgi:hypothetical protein
MIDHPGLKFHTPRNPDRPTRGPRIAKFAELFLRRPFMPWQRDWVDRATELDGDGNPVYPVVLTTVQRQAGKSMVALAKSAERCVSVMNTRSWYTAQTGYDARDQWKEFADHVDQPDMPLGLLTNSLRGAGAEIMKFRNGSSLRPHPPTEKALHGKQSDINDIDEGWAFTKEQGEALMQAIAPTQLTRVGAQTWIHSAGGTAASTWLAELVDLGRGGAPGICYTEYGIPDDLPLDDLRAIALHHPAFGHTINLQAIKTLRANIRDDNEFARAAGNRWTEVIGGAIPAELWKDARHADPIPDGVTVGYGAAISADRTETVVVAAAQVGGLVVGEVLDVITNPYGAAPRVAAWATDGPLAVDSRGPSASLADALADFPRLMSIGTPEATAAAANLLDGLHAGVVKARRHPSLDAAVQVAVKRLVADGAFLWARQSAGASIAALEAFGLATFAVGHRPIPAPRPMMRVPGE